MSDYDIDVRAALDKIDEILNTLEATEKNLIELLGTEIRLAGEVILEIESMRNSMKQMRGQVMEFIV